MFGSTHRIRRTTTAIAVVGSLALLAVPASLAFDGRSPDTKDAAQQARLSTLVKEQSSNQCRNAAARCIYGLPHPAEMFGRESTQLASSNPCAKASARCIYGLPHPAEMFGRESAQLASSNRCAKASARCIYGLPHPAEMFGSTSGSGASSSSSFNWGDAGIGAAAAVGFILLLAGLGAGLVAGRTQPRQPRHV